MAIDNDPIFTLDILGSQNNDASNCMLRQNKTKMLVRGSREYITTFRNDLLRNRGYDILETHQDNWSIKINDYWTPAHLAHCESWLEPDYYSPLDTDETLCVWANNRIGFDPDDTAVGAGGFEQQTENQMPTFNTGTGGTARNYTGIKFDGTNDSMRGKANTVWQTSTSDFMCFMAFGYGDITEKQPIVSKKNKSSFLFEIDRDSGNKFFLLNINDVELSSSSVNSGSEECTIVGFGRDGGQPFIRRLGVEADVKGSSDTANLNENHKAWIGDYSAGLINEFDGTLWELIFINNAGAGSDEVTDENMSKLEGYLAWKYGEEANLWDGHPYEDAPPKADDRIINN